MIISSFYRNNNSEKIEFSRFIKHSDCYQYIAGIILYQEELIQAIKENEFISFDKIDEIKNQLIKKGFRNSFDDSKKVMWLQINVKNLDDYQSYEIKDFVEKQLEEALIKNGKGKWLEKTMGDTHPKNIDLLININNWDEAYSLAIDIIKNKKLTESCLIAKRLTIDEEGWSYEIVFPLDYDGIFAV